MCHLVALYIFQHPQTWQIFTLGFHSFSAAAGETGLWKQAELRVTSVFSNATCHTLKSAHRLFSRLDLTDAKGTRCEVLWHPGAGSLRCEAAEASDTHFLCKFFLLLQVLSLSEIELANAVNFKQFVPINYSWKVWVPSEISCFPWKHTWV